MHRTGQIITDEAAINKGLQLVYRAYRKMIARGVPVFTKERIDRLEAKDKQKIPGYNYFYVLMFGPGSNDPVAIMRVLEARDHEYIHGSQGLEIADDTMTKIGFESEFPFLQGTLEKVRYEFGRVVTPQESKHKMDYAGELLVAALSYIELKNDRLLQISPIAGPSESGWHSMGVMTILPGGDPNGPRIHYMTPNMLFDGRIGMYAETGPLHQRPYSQATFSPFKSPEELEREDTFLLRTTFDEAQEKILNPLKQARNTDDVEMIPEILSQLRPGFLVPAKTIEAYRRLQHGDWHGALPIYQQLARRHPQRIVFHGFELFCLFALQKWSELYEKAISIIDFFDHSGITLERHYRWDSSAFEAPNGVFPAYGHGVDINGILRLAHIATGLAYIERGEIDLGILKLYLPLKHFTGYEEPFGNDDLPILEMPQQALNAFNLRLRELIKGYGEEDFVLVLEKILAQLSPLRENTEEERKSQFFRAHRETIDTVRVNAHYLSGLIPRHLSGLVSSLYGVRQDFFAVGDQLRQLPEEERPLIRFYLSLMVISEFTYSRGAMATALGSVYLPSDRAPLLARRALYHLLAGAPEIYRELYQMTEYRR